MDPTSTQVLLGFPPIKAMALMIDMIFLIFRYILSEMQPPPVGVTASLEILTRLARQSRTTALNIACTPRLLDTIVRNFIPLSSDRLSEYTRTSALNSDARFRFNSSIISQFTKTERETLTAYRAQQL